ncbi:hypothetical protein [Clostridium aceticum]|uniref:hypothetical protein n=1 Tax=Clostridium aceticum TaxID=84022 RepID=UPI00130D6812|nr:hypothetical protein [Clostridium aceticum]
MKTTKIISINLNHNLSSFVIPRSFVTLRMTVPEDFGDNCVKLTPKKLKYRGKHFHKMFRKNNKKNIQKTIDNKV